MAGLRPLLSGMGLVILFSIALFMFMIQFIGVNNPDPITSNTQADPIVNSTFTALQARANQLDALGNSSQALLSSYQPSSVYLFLIAYSAFAIPLGFLSFLIQSVGTIFTFLFTSIFGAGSSPFYIVLVVINGLILLAIVLMILRAIRTGETER